MMTSVSTLSPYLNALPNGNRLLEDGGYGRHYRRVHDLAGDGRGHRHGGICKGYLRSRIAHPPDVVPVRGGYAHLARTDHAHVGAEASAACGGGDAGSGQR